MIPQPIEVQPRYPLAEQQPDWSDEIRDSVSILQDRDYEENGRSPEPERSYFA
jgi:hypothetical protein